MLSNYKINKYKKHRLKVTFPGELNSKLSDDKDRRQLPKDAPRGAEDKPENRKKQIEVYDEDSEDEIKKARSKEPVGVLTKQ